MYVTFIVDNQVHAVFHYFTSVMRQVHLLAIGIVNCSSFDIGATEILG